jgi:hypothetical protein
MDRISNNNATHNTQGAGAQPRQAQPAPLAAVSILRRINQAAPIAPPIRQPSLPLQSVPMEEPSTLRNVRLIIPQHDLNIRQNSYINEVMHEGAPTRDTPPRSPERSND